MNKSPEQQAKAKEQENTKQEKTTDEASFKGLSSLIWKNKKQ